MNLIDRAVSMTLPIVPKPIVRYFSKRYIAGTTIDDAFAVVRDLRGQGAMSTLDILGEFISKPEQADRNTAAYEELVERIGQDRLPDAHVSIKLTALGLLLDQQLCLENMRRVMRGIEKHDNFLRIDMEDSPCTSATISIYKTLRQEFGHRVGIVLQSRMRRTLDDIDDIVGSEPESESEGPGSNFRICKGIYLEPRPIAYTDPELIRRNFMASLDRMFAAGSYVGIATHDERLVWEGLRFVRKYGLERDQYEFQMLLGVDEELRKILIDAGHRLRVYVPYGEQWYAYSVRRLRENPQIAGYALKAIVQRT